jgi:DNA-directed RNA polymerase II subunit RPB2
MGKVITRGNACLIPVLKTMERDCILGQGAASFEKDRIMTCSDEFKMWICNVCGLQAKVEKGGETRECNICGMNNASLVKIPYGTKLVNQELTVMNIVPRIFTVKREGDK